tara:strand:- start:140 stop:637 length:498 start_codon:yes stop_codon:yes gene_type:complete
MVKFQIDFWPVFFCGFCVLIASLALGGLIQGLIAGGEYAILRPVDPPANPSIILSGSKEAVYAIIGLAHFGGMAAGFAICLLAFFSRAFSSEDDGDTVRLVAIFVVAPIAFLVACAVWLGFVLPSFPAFRCPTCATADQFWLWWMLVLAALLITAWIRLALDAFV